MPAQSAANAPFMSQTGDRWTPVDRTPYYFNAKAESSAFDRFFNSTTLASLDARQDYFVRYSKKLKEVIEGKLSSLDNYRVERVAENFLPFYDATRYVNKFCRRSTNPLATSPTSSTTSTRFRRASFFETAARSYSECFAGSGDLAVVNLILALENLEPYGLLLLDEPETSLHPGAQEKLTEHLLRIVNEKHIQVIISTHSPTFVQLLPATALVVLEETPAGIAPRHAPTKASAFERLGQIDKEKYTILTEDVLLKAVVDRAVARLPKPLNNKTVVVAAGLGVSEMLSNQARAHDQAGSKVLMVLDGDQKAVEAIFTQDPDDLSAKQEKTVIDQLRKQQHHVSIVGSKTDLESWMRWCKGHVVLIDEVCPEQILLELMAPGHELLHNSSATNAQFKSAVRKVLHQTKNEPTAEAQYHILKLKLGKSSEAARSTSPSVP